jgi:hypothetical protein
MGMKKEAGKLKWRLEKTALSTSSQIHAPSSILDIYIHLFPFVSLQGLEENTE